MYDPQQEHNKEHETSTSVEHIPPTNLLFRVPKYNMEFWANVASHFILVGSSRPCIPLPTFHAYIPSPHPFPIPFPSHSHWRTCPLDMKNGPCQSLQWSFHFHHRHAYVAPQDWCAPAVSVLRCRLGRMGLPHPHPHPQPQPLCERHLRIKRGQGSVDALKSLELRGGERDSLRGQLVG